MNSNSKILDIINNFGWIEASKRIEITDEFIMKYYNIFEHGARNSLIMTHKIPEDFIEEYKDDINWLLVLKFQKLSEKFLRKQLTQNYFNKDCWKYISKYQSLSLKFIEEFKNKLYWEWIIKRKKLPEYFIEKHLDKIGIENALYYQKVLENFIRKYIKNIKPNWGAILKKQDLSESFIEEFIDKLSLFDVFATQKLSGPFILKYKDKLNCWPELILVNKKITQDTIIYIWNYMPEYGKQAYLDNLNQIDKLLFLSKVKKEK